MARARATPRAKVGYPRASRHGGGAGYAHRSERHRPGPAQAAGTRDSQSRGRCRELRAFFADLLGKATAFVLIAERSGDAVGWLSFDVQERPSTPFTRARRRPYVQHVAVCDTARRSAWGRRRSRGSGAKPAPGASRAPRALPGPGTRRRRRSFAPAASGRSTWCAGATRVRRSAPAGGTDADQRPVFTQRTTSASTVESA